ncbi:uncharacterized protein LOC133188425 [Saccostrea echinata]|uniref:uncharacterized protein LOC133188425 n=1 Tax=Saccostrea echinata TaxID=191078 RepID=UPI002A7F3D75|nr:uncharacterized protein LOC133188425 [Saccostrea echinata]
MSYNTRSRGKMYGGTIEAMPGHPETRGVVSSRSKQEKVFSDPQSVSPASPFYESFKTFGLQDEPPDYIKNPDAPKKNGTSCVITGNTPGKNKVMAPRSEDISTRLPEKDLSEKDETIEDYKLTTNVTIDLLDQMINDHGISTSFGQHVDVRVSEPQSLPQQQFQVAEHQNQDVESQALPIKELTLFDNQTSVYHDLTGQECSPSTGKCQSQGVGYQVEDERLDVDTSTYLSEANKALHDDIAMINTEIDTCTDTELSEYLMGIDNATEQEMTCGDLMLELPLDSCVLDAIIYGTEKAVGELANNHKNEILNTGVHGVYTDPRFEVLKSEFQDPPSIYSTLLGKGTFGVAIKCIVSDDFVFVKKKVTQKFHPEEAIFTLSNTHPNIIKSYALVLRHGTPEIIMEYAGQSLLSLLNEKKTLPEVTIWSLTWEFCNGLSYLDSKNVIHFDIKPENIFVMEDEEGGYLLKIGDFGSARMPEGPIEMTAWTPEYLAPEMAKLFLRKNFPPHVLKIKQTEQDIEASLQPKTDMYPAGLVVCFMYVGEHLLLQYIRRAKPDVTDEKQQRLAVIGHVSHETELGVSLIPEAAGPEMKAVLLGMLQYDVTKRASAKKTLELMTTLSAQKNNENKVTLSKGIKPQVLKIPVGSEGVNSKEKRILPVKSKARNRRSRSRKECEPLTSQMPQMSRKAEEILSENKQLRKRIVRSELKRKLQTRPTAAVAAKVVKTGEAKEEIDHSQGGISEGSQVGGFSEQFVPLEQPFPEIQISEHQHPVCQAEDDWSIQESAAPGNMPDFGCLGIDDN